MKTLLEIRGLKSEVMEFTELARTRVNHSSWLPSSVLVLAVTVLKATP
jgi:hypothetical protein